MEKRQAFKFELMPNGSQARATHRLAGMCRFVDKKTLAQQNENRANGLKYTSDNGSCNWMRAKRKVQKAHAIMSNARQDFLHKLSHQIARDHALVVVEALRSKNMTRQVSISVASTNPI